MIWVSQNVFWLKLILLAVLDVPVAVFALYYGHRPGGSMAIRQSLYTVAFVLWILVVVAGVTR